MGSLSRQQDRVASPGKFRVLGIDTFDNEHWVEGEYDSEEQALETARAKTKEAAPSASDASIATVYYAYNDQGKYLGGDIYQDE
jgi:hypothetical protein